MRFVSLVFLLSVFALPTLAAPRVIVSISPIHALVAAVTRGVLEPQLLLNRNVSLHHYQFRPSDMVALSSAQVVFLLNPEFETFLAKPLANLGNPTKIVTLSQAKGLTANLYLHSDHEHVHDHDHAHMHDHDHVHSGIDYHLWLNPLNAIAMVGEVTRTMIALDPDNAKIYRRNSKLYVEKLTALDKSLARKFAPYRGVGFLAAHDALGTLAHHYQLNYHGGLVTSHELPSSIKALEALEQQIKEDDIRCIFTEPTTPLKLAEIMADHTGVDLQMVDIEWAPEPLPGADATFLREPYVQLMQQLADKMTQCFALKEGKTLAARR